MPKKPQETKSVKIAKNILLVLLCVFSAASVVFSLFVLFGDLGGTRAVSPAQARGLFTVFIFDHINEVHPTKLPSGSTWQVTNLEFQNKNLAIVDTTDGHTRSKLEFIFVIEYPNVRILKVNDITGRDLEDANLTLVRFLTDMQGADYLNAAALYGGSISRLVQYGSESSSLPKLLEEYCAKATVAAHCLPFKITEARKNVETGTYNFTVKYTAPDKTLFTLPDGTSLFTASVEAKDSSVFRVVTLPFDH